MHMADALLSPPVGLGFWAVSGGALAYAARRLRSDATSGAPPGIARSDGSMEPPADSFADEPTRLVPLMGVMGAFVFAAQMINFAIPGTGSSGHLGGGMLLGLMLGPWAAFVVLVSVVTVQCLVFADGGLLALGCNIFNLGALPCFAGLPLARTLAGRAACPARAAAAIVTACTAVALLGAVSVASQTTMSGLTDLPFPEFAAVMAAIHLPVGVVEGAVTTAVLRLIERIRPGEPGLAAAAAGRGMAAAAGRVPALFGAAAVVLLLGLSGLASSRPDGLDWSIERVAGGAEIHPRHDPVSRAAAATQERTALPEDYALPVRGAEPVGTAAAGLAGAAIVLGSTATIGLVLGRWRRRRPQA